LVHMLYGASTMTMWTTHSINFKCCYSCDTI